MRAGWGVRVSELFIMREVKKMPFGFCPGCLGQAYLPDFGEGLCFLCATDGPPADPSRTGGSVREDLDGRLQYELIDEKREERVLEVLEEFSSQQERFSRAIGAAHYRSQRFTTWVKPKRYHREISAGPVGPTVAELKSRVERKRAKEERDQIRAARLGKLREQIEARLQLPRDYVAQVESTRARRKGAGNFAPPEKVALAQEMRRQGASLRAIVSAVGLSKETVNKYTDWIPRPQAIRNMHVRLKREGRPSLPPWQKRRRSAA